MPNDPEKPVTVDDLPWDPRKGKEIWEWFDYLYYFPYQQGVKPESVTPAVTQVVAQIEAGQTVREWLPEHLAKLDAIATSYRLTHGRDKFEDIVFDKVKEYYFDEVKEYFGPQVEAQLVILFRPALKKVKRDPLLVLSDLEAVSGEKVERRGVVVIVIVLDDISALSVSPVIGTGLAENISHTLFKQLASAGQDFMVVRARRSRRRLSQPIE